MDQTVALVELLLRVLSHERGLVALMFACVIVVAGLYLKRSSVLWERSDRLTQEATEARDMLRSQLKNLADENLRLHERLQQLQSDNEALHEHLRRALHEHLRRK